METALLVILIIIANLVLYWLFWGKRKAEKQMIFKEEGNKEEGKE